MPVQLGYKYEKRKEKTYAHHEAYEWEGSYTYEFLPPLRSSHNIPPNF
jgi:hypothetical protein